MQIKFFLDFLVEILESNRLLVSFKNLVALRIQITILKGVNKVAYSVRRKYDSAVGYIVGT